MQESFHHPSENSFSKSCVTPILSITQKELENILTHSRSKETSLDPDFWEQASRDRVQCMPTSFVVQRLFGGDIAAERFLMQDIMTRRLKKIPHFLNIIDGNPVDFTREQIKYRESIKHVKILQIGAPSVLKNQNKEDYYAFFVDTGIQAKEALLFENIKKRINATLDTDLDMYLAAGKKIQLLE